jgi:aminoglycoside 6'-N-acetyltransferase
MNNENKLTFRPLSFDDISLVHRWFNRKHVQTFYSLRSWTEEEVLKKLTPYITGEKPVYWYIIFLDDLPIGSIQYYSVVNFPWPGQDFSEEVIQHSAGMDLFIGESDYIGKGFGTSIIQQFLDAIIWPKFNYCVVDPDIRNNAMLRCNEKIGFKEHKIIQTTDTLGQPVQLKLMILDKKSSSTKDNKI